MFLSEREVMLPKVASNGKIRTNGRFRSNGKALSNGSVLGYLSQAVQGHLGKGEVLTRFVVTDSSTDAYRCEVGVLDPEGQRHVPKVDSILRFSRRARRVSGPFNVALVVPTGVGCEIGGHAGDAGPVATLLATACDSLITHPNVVNASDIMELPSNGLYVEGSVLSRLFMGTIGLQPVRANRVLTIIDEHQDEYFINQAINAVSAARSCYGLQCPAVVRMAPPIKMAAQYAPSGRAIGRIDGLDRLQEILEAHRGEYDAVAIATVIDVPSHYHMDYFRSMGAMINPWGGVEAMLTHWVSLVYDVPSAHSPMLESQQVADLNPGVVDSRIAAEAISLTFMQCILKGLQRSPRIVTDETLMARDDVLTAGEVSCLVIPDGCVGLPTLAALEQGITVIAVRENRNVMKNDLSALPWAPGQFYAVENYWEACGVLLALRQGLAPESVRRPLARTTVERKLDIASLQKDESWARGVLQRVAIPS